MTEAQIITAVLGVLGFLISSYNLWRAIQSSREVRSLAFAQRKQEALAAINDGIAANLAVKRQLRDISDEASDEHLLEVKSKADGFAEDQQRHVDMLENAKSEIIRLGSSSRTHSELVNMMENQLAQIKELTHTKKIEEEAQEFLQPAKRAITVAKRERSVHNA